MLRRELEAKQQKNNPNKRPHSSSSSKGGQCSKRPGYLDQLTPSESNELSLNFSDSDDDLDLLDDDDDDDNSSMHNSDGSSGGRQGANGGLQRDGKQSNNNNNTQHNHSITFSIDSLLNKS